MHLSKRHLLAGAAVATCVGAGTAQAQVRFNELLFDAPGANTDKRFVEVRSATGGVDLSDLTVLQIDGDGSATGAIDSAIPFGNVATGSNGLALLRDSAVVLSPAPAAETTVVNSTFQTNENTTISFLLVRGFTGMAGGDIDADNDGTPDAVLPFTEVLDAVGFRDAATDNVFGARFGGVDFNEADAPFNGTDIGGFLRDETGAANAFRAQAEGGSATGPFSVELSGTLPTGFAITPGNVNPNVVPEPASLGLLAFAGLMLARRRRA